MSLHEWFEVGKEIWAMLVPGGAIYSCSGMTHEYTDTPNISVLRRVSADSLCFVPMSLQAQEEFYKTFCKDREIQ